MCSVNRFLLSVRVSLCVCVCVSWGRHWLTEFILHGCSDHIEWYGAYPKLQRVQNLPSFKTTFGLQQSRASCLQTNVNSDAARGFEATISGPPSSHGSALDHSAQLWNLTTPSCYMIKKKKDYRHQNYARQSKLASLPLPSEKIDEKAQITALWGLKCTKY